MFRFIIIKYLHRLLLSPPFARPVDFFYGAAEGEWRGGDSTTPSPFRPELRETFAEKIASRPVQNAAIGNLF